MKLSNPKLCYIFRLPAMVILLTLLAPLTPVLGVDQVSPDQFGQANRLYEAGKYSEALALYLQIQENGGHWRLYYNTGNCCFKLNRLVKAKIYYLKALRLAPFEESIQKNIAIVNHLLYDKIQPPKADFVSRVMLRIESILSLDALSVLLILMAVSFNAFLFLLILKGKRRWVLYGIAFSLVFTILTAGYHMYRAGKFQRRQVAVIIKDGARLRSGPGGNNTILFKVNPGLQVKIIDSSSSGQWLQVSASAEIAGWVEAEDLERI